MALLRRVGLVQLTCQLLCSMGIAVMLACVEKNDVTHPQKSVATPRSTPLLTGKNLASFQSLLKRIPEGETVLVEGYRIQSPSLSSVMSAEAGEPGFVDFGGLPHSSAVRDALDRLGIKYVSWSSEPAAATHTLARRLRFLEFISNHVHPVQQAGSWHIARLKKKRPAITPQRLVAYLGCSPNYPRGLYDFSALDLPHQKHQPQRVISPDEWSRRRALARVDFVIYDPHCQSEPVLKYLTKFEPIGRHQHQEIWMRSAPTPKRSIRKNGRWIPTRKRSKSDGAHSQPPARREVPDVQKPLKILNLNNK